MKAKLHIGTSGWYYEHWKETFYPKTVPSDQRLPFYSEHFTTVEINNTFYNLPFEKTITNWYDKVPNEFIFSVKASGYITHRKRLKDPLETTTKFLERIGHLKEKLGPILFQLPPSLKQDLPRLEAFLEALEKGLLYVFEFRHPSWYTDETYALLKKHSVALCITDLKGELSPEIITAPFTYIRLHGPKEAAYTGQYGPKRLGVWKDRIERWLKQKISVYCYFDNDEKSYATQDALELKQQLL